MSMLIVKQRLRPLRLAFLVNVSDAAMLRQVIRINSCLWGGRYNAIIPVFDEQPVPANLAGMSAEDIKARYLKLFEPDFVVDTTAPILMGAKDEGLEPHLFGLDDVVSSNGAVTLGLGITALLHKLYEDELQFTRRHPSEATFTESDNLFLCASHGSLSGSGFLDFYKNAYITVFEAKPSDDSPEGYAKALLLDRPITVLDAGSFGIGVPRPQEFGYFLMLLNEDDPADVMEFWNLRALGRRVIGIPMRWQNDLAPLVLQRLNDYVGRVGFFSMGMFTVRGAASVLHNEYQVFAARLSGAPQSLVATFGRYMEPWSEKRDDVEAAAKTEDLEPRDEYFIFSSLSPDFAPEIGSKYPRWANIVTVDYGWETGQTGMVLPTSITDIRKVFDAEHGRVYLRDEGIVEVCYFDRGHHWKVPTNLKIVSEALASSGLTVEINEKGSTAYEIVRSLGSLSAMLSIANVELIDLLDSTTRGAVNFEGNVISRQQCWALLRKIHMPQKQGKWTPEEKERARKAADHIAGNHLKNLLEGNVFKVGLKIKCSKCNQNGWHSLESLSDELLCRRCLQRFKFPAHDPDKQTWSYHTTGPFSTAKYAHGSYTVVLALWYLITRIQARATWVPSVDVFEGMEKREADFIAFWRDGFSPTQMLIGECKTFGEFDAKDRDRAEFFLQKFPDAFFVFASLRKDLSFSDRRWLRDFSSRASVIILGTAELASDARVNLFFPTADEHGIVLERSQLKNLSNLTLAKYLAEPPIQEQELELQGHA